MAEDWPSPTPSLEGVWRGPDIAEAMKLGKANQRPAAALEFPTKSLTFLNNGGSVVPMSSLWSPDIQ